MATQTQSLQDAGLNQPSNTELLLRQQVDLLQLVIRELKLMNIIIHELANGLPVNDDLEVLRQDPAFNDFVQMEN